MSKEDQVDQGGEDRIVHFICKGLTGVYTSMDNTMFVSAEWALQGGDNTADLIREVRLHESKASGDYKRGVVERWWKDDENGRYIFLCKTLPALGEVVGNWSQEKAFSPYSQPVPQADL